MQREASQEPAHCPLLGSSSLTQSYAEKRGLPDAVEGLPARK